MLRRSSLVTLALLSACDRTGAGSAPSPRASVSSPAPASSAPPAPSAPASAPGSASARAASSAPTALRATALQVGPRGPGSARMTLLQTEPDERALLLNEDTGDFLLFDAKPEGEGLRLSSPALELSLRLPVSKSAGALQLPGVSPVPVVLREEPAAGAGKPAPRAFLGADGVSVEVPVEGREGRLFREGTGRGARMAVLYKERWLPAVPSLPQPRAVGLGGKRLAPTPLTPGRELGCLVYGVAPVIEGPLAELFQQTWRSWVSERCAAAGASAAVELSYGTVVLAGVNLMECYPDLSNPRPAGPCHSPSSTVHVPVNLVARVTTDAGSTVVEEAFLLDTGAVTLPRLASLVTPEGATFLRRSVQDSFTPRAPWLPRTAATWPPPEALAGLPPTTLTVGPTSIDVVLPPLPFGLFLSTRHVIMGPRSQFATTFAPSPATRRLTAAVFVDY